MIVTTMSGFGGFSGSRTLTLDARGVPVQSTPDKAWHVIPPGMNMGPNLALIRPEQYSVPASERDVANNPEYENWTMKIYWGSSKTVQKGQPMTISTKDLAAGRGKVPALYAGSRSQIYKGPPKSGWGWGTWPNKQATISVPSNASLEGEHFIHGNYLPHIKFNMANHDFMPGVKARAGGDLAASIPVTWETVPGAIGYFAYAMAVSEAKREMVIWTSSKKATAGIQGPEHSLDIRRMIDDGVVLNAKTLAADIPEGIFNGYENPVVMLHAWGEDYWASYPPKPKKPPEGWKPDWTVNAMFYTSWSGIPGVEMPEMPQTGGSGNAIEVIPDINIRMPNITIPSF
jgi:hypothetical protein